MSDTIKSDEQVMDLDELRELAGAAKKIDFAAVFAEAGAKFDAEKAAREVRSEADVRNDIFNYTRALIDANLQDNDEAFKKLAHTVGTVLIDNETYLHISMDGTEYEDAECFVSEKDGKVYKFDENFCRLEVADPFIVEQALILVAQYRAGEEGCDRRRTKLVEEAANGNEMLHKVLRASIDFNNGFLQKPSQKEGIDFYPVGRNASHEFYLGVKDGKLFSLSSGEDSYIQYQPGDPEYTSREMLIERGYFNDDDLKDEETVCMMVEQYNLHPVYGEHIREVNPDAPGYLGHY